MKHALPLALLGLLALTACSERSAPDPVSSEGKLNGDATVPPATGTPPARADAEDPATGTNSRRPDSPRDLQPGTDGNTPAVR